MPKARFKDFADLVLMPHSLFSLSFGLAAGIRASRWCFSPKDALLAVLAFIFARTAANAFNRYADASIDALNPRTKGRHIPTGLITRGEALALSAFSALAFFLASWAIEPALALLALPAAGLFFLYSYAKRFTALCHLMLGAASACAPLGASLALCRSIDLEIVFIAIANGAWIAGFDVLYSLRDASFDRAHGLRSIPVALGEARAKAIGFTMMASCPLAFLFLSTARIAGFHGLDAGFSFLGLGVHGTFTQGAIATDLIFYLGAAITGILFACKAMNASKRDDDGIYDANIAFSISLISVSACAFAIERIAL